MLIAFLACLLFSIVDYVGFNLTKSDEKTLAIYRVIQYIVQIAITVAVWDIFTWKEAIGWLVMWWTFFCDFLYYGWAWLLNPVQWNWEGRAGLSTTINNVTWAWWTPYGLFFNGLKNKSKIIPWETLAYQCSLGVWLAIFITEWVKW